MRRLILLALLAVAAYVGHRVLNSEGDVAERLEDARRQIELEPGRIGRAAEKVYRSYDLDRARGRSVRSNYEKAGTSEQREKTPAPEVRAEPGR